MNYPYPGQPTTTQAWGNSITLGLGSTTGNDYPSRLAARWGYSVGNSGIGGETSIQITNRVSLNFNRRGYLNFFEMGRNNPTAVDQIMSDLNTCIRRCGGHFIILGILRGTADTQTVIDSIGDANNRMRVKYRERFLDLNARLVAMGAPLGPYPDAVNYAANVAPAAARYDTLHPNNIGYQEIANAVGEIVESIYPTMPIGFCPVTAVP